MTIRNHDNSEFLGIPNHDNSEFLGILNPDKSESLEIPNYNNHRLPQAKACLKPGMDDGERVADSDAHGTTAAREEARTTRRRHGDRELSDNRCLDRSSAESAS